MGSWPAADADRWWASLPPSRREQIHRWMCPGAQEERLPEHQLVLDVAAEADGVGTGH
jgi:hypothetical protein